MTLTAEPLSSLKLFREESGAKKKRFPIRIRWACRIRGGGMVGLHARRDAFGQVQL